MISSSASLGWTCPSSSFWSLEGMHNFSSTIIPVNGPLSGRLRAVPHDYVEYEYRRENILIYSRWAVHELTYPSLIDFAVSSSPVQLCIWIYCSSVDTAAQKISPLAYINVLTSFLLIFVLNFISHLLSLLDVSCKTGGLPCILSLKLNLSTRIQILLFLNAISVLASHSQLNS
jgi:hypothetical protein